MRNRPHRTGVPRLPNLGRKGAVIASSGLDCDLRQGRWASTHVVPFAASPRRTRMLGGRASSSPMSEIQYCQQLWHVVALNVDSGIAPCRYLYKNEKGFGSIAEQSLQDIRASERYRIARGFSPAVQSRRTCLPTTPAAAANW